MRIITLTLLSFSTATALLAQSDNPAEHSVKVPVIGCPADGQVGPVKTAAPSSKLVPIPSHAAQQLAWYVGPTSVSSIGVLGPRGWHCFETYGSSGATLYVSPEATDANKLIFHTNWKGFEGFAIEISESYGDSSGRFAVAKMIARLFPAHLDFTRKVIAEGIEPPTNFPTGAFPGDKLTDRSNAIVEFETPPNTNGLGTMSSLLKNSFPIRGVAILSGKQPNLLQLSLRLPANSADIANVIIQQTEREATGDAH